MAFMDFVASVAIVSIGMVYPAYKSFKSVKSENVAGMKAWMKYWIVLSVLAALMLLVEPLLYPRVPMYNVLKIAVVAYLVLPMTKGYAQVYDQVLIGQLARHEGAIDKAADDFVRASEAHARALGPKVNEGINKFKAMAAGKKAK
jgi:receptor expression-enhancing protein 1/2/3/4